MSISDRGDLNLAGADVYHASVAARALGVVVAVSWVKLARRVRAGGGVHVTGRTTGGRGACDGRGVEGAGVRSGLMLLGGELRKMVILMLLLLPAVCVHAGRTVNVSN